MVRAFRTVICTLAVGSAYRQRLEADSVTSVHNKIGSLVGMLSAAGVKDDILSRVLAKNTPGYSDSLSTIITQVIADLEQDVETKIINGFDATQDAIGTKINELRSATEEAVGKKSSADGADAAWAGCIVEEITKRKEDETAQTLLEEAQAAVIEPCNNQENSKTFETAPMEPLHFECAFDVAGNCETQLTNFDSQVQSINNGVKDNYEDKLGVWSGFKQQCDDAHSLVGQRTDAKAGTSEAYQSKRLACTGLHETRSVAMCGFGDSLQMKCVKANLYTELIAEVTGDGSDHSQPDRELEWKSVTVTKCMLSIVGEGGLLDQTALTGCETNIKFAGDGRTLNEMAGDFADLSTVPNFTCEEQAFTFATGEAWVVPSGSAPPSEDYHLQPFKPAVDITVGAYPFDFCALAQPGKR